MCNRDSRYDCGARAVRLKGEGIKVELNRACISIVKFNFKFHPNMLLAYDYINFFLSKVIDEQLCKFCYALLTSNPTREAVS